MQDIAGEINCSLNKVKYWMVKHGIPTRSISEAVYIKNNPNGDPFKIKTPRNKNEALLKGLGLGLYWGEGTKANKVSVRLGNTDPALINNFIKFLIRCYNIDKKDLKFGLQLFNDINPEEALHFWRKYLKVTKNQFQKVVVTPSRGPGTYRKKVKFGVLTVYYHNRKLRDIICEELKKLGFYG
ncbi:MAG: hypothetical protein WED06_03035 [Candidatus Paceibacterota bacterium]